MSTDEKTETSLPAYVGPHKIVKATRWRGREYFPGDVVEVSSWQEYTDLAEVEAIDGPGARKIRVRDARG